MIAIFICSAGWGADYVYQQTPLTFQPGEKAGDTHMVFIDISQDTTIEETETFQLYLSYQNVMPSADDALGMSTIHISDQTSMSVLNLCPSNWIHLTIIFQLLHLVLKELST